MITVISCGLGHLPPEEAGTLADARVVFGSRRLLETLGVPPEKRRVLAADAAKDAAEALRLAQSGQAVVVLATGDALFHGMGGTLVRQTAHTDLLRFVPGITAFQALFHRLHLPWDKARLHSIHKDAPTLPLRELLDAPLSVIYAGSRCTASQLAARLLDFHPASAQRQAVVADSLGTPLECIRRGTLDTLAALTVSPTSILVLLPEGMAPQILPLGLPVEAFEREAGLITPPDVRAVVLSRLRLPRQGCLWDIGAGSGSVGLEAAGLCPDLDVVAVERHPARADMIRRNAARMGLARHSTVQGAFADVAHSLPAPQRIFFGGGGADLPRLLDMALERLAPGGLLAACAVTLETQHRLFAWRPELRTALCAVNVAVERPLAGQFHHLEPQRVTQLFVFTRAD